MQTFISFFRSSILFTLILYGSICDGYAISFKKPLTDSLQISLITCGPGEDLYSTFGHSAVRVKDYSSGADYVFNYGTFDFSTPHFYWKFMRGRLLYFLSVQDFQVFLRVYKEEGRSVTEQILNLTPAEKQAVFDYLKTNYLPENRYYKYDFLFDNCSTRIGDIIAKIFGASWQIEDIIPTEDLSFRQIINVYLADKPWEKLGINLMFGKKADQEMTNRQVMFLPDFLMKGFGHSTINGKPLVKQTLILYTPAAKADTGYPFYRHPLFWLSLVALVIVILSLARPCSFSIRLLPWIDRCLYFLTGLLGCFLLFMWFGTDHQITVWNFNLLWLLPFNLVFSFYFFKNTKWVRGYAILLLCINVFLLAGWSVLPQQLPAEAIPVMIILSARAWKTASRAGMGIKLKA